MSRFIEAYRKVIRNEGQSTRGIMAGRPVSPGVDLPGVMGSGDSGPTRDIMAGEQARPRLTPDAELDRRKVEDPARRYEVATRLQGTARAYLDRWQRYQREKAKRPERPVTIGDPVEWREGRSKFEVVDGQDYVSVGVFTRRRGQRERQKELVLIQTSKDGQIGVGTPRTGVDGIYLYSNTDPDNYVSEYDSGYTARLIELSLEYHAR